MEGTFVPIDLKTWERGEVYSFYMDEWGAITNSIARKIDITPLITEIKKRNMKTVPALMYIFSCGFNRQMNFKIRCPENENLGYYDIVHPTFTVLSPNGNINYHTIPFTSNFRLFYESYLKDQADYPAEKKYPMAHTVTPPPNNFIISVMNYLSFDSFSFNIKYSKKFFAPFVILGKYTEENGKFVLPVSLTINRACADEKHLTALFGDIDNYISSCQEWL